jgi:RimJ/RimL family protein N-acetyltransferase
LEASLPVEAIRTARLDLVPLAVADADEMVAVLADTSLYAFTGEAPPDFATLRERYERQSLGRSADGTEQWLNWIARLRDAGVAIGFVQATVSASGSRADVAWLVGVPWQRRGFASEAAAAMISWLQHAGVRDIEAHIRPGHIGSAAVARRAGLAPTSRYDGDGEQVWRPEVSPARRS